MGNRTKIEWCDSTWSPTMGCTPVSEGCRNCYARTMINRFAGRPGWPSSVDKIVLFPHRLEQPFRWRKPRTVFVNSMSDLFHDDVPFEYIAAVFGVMAANPKHQFVILTKRNERMLEWFEWLRNSNESMEVGRCYAYSIRYGVTENLASWQGYHNGVWPLPNVNIGVSVENQKTADERIPILLQTPAAKRFVSAEPLLGPIEFNLATKCDRRCNEYQEAYCPGTSGKCCMQVDVDQIIVGAETGPGKRLMEFDWARSIRDQCQMARVPFFFKKDSDGNRELDGRVWEEMPR